MPKFQILLQLVFAIIQAGVSENAELREIRRADAENIVLFNAVVLLYFEEKKQDCVHRFDVPERVPCEKNLQEQSFQRTRREREIDERLVFRF